MKELSPQDRLKKLAAERAVESVASGMKLGLGTGSTAYFVVQRIGELMKTGELTGITGIPNSKRTEEQARSLGIPIATLAEHPELDLAIDGADEVDPQKNLIKGGGGAHLRERLVALAAAELVVIVDEQKLVPVLGRTFALPVEVVSFGWRHTARRVAATGCEVQRRERAGAPVLSDNGNVLLDCRYPGIADPAALQRTLDAVPGVVDHGLFVGLAGRVVVADARGEVRVLA